MMSTKVTRTIKNALAQLQDERSRIDTAISKLEVVLDNLGDLERGGTQGRRQATRAAAAVAQLLSGRHRKRSTAGWTTDKRAAAADRMKRYWARQRRERTAARAGRGTGAKATRATARTTDRAASAKDRGSDRSAERGIERGIEQKRARQQPSAQRKSA